MYYDPPPGFNIVELDTEIRGEDNEQDKMSQGSGYSFRARTAAIQQREKDVERMLRHGWDPIDISELIRVPLCVVKARVARLEEERDDGKSQLERELAILEGDF